MIEKKSVMHSIMLNVIAIVTVIAEWWIIGYSLAFGGGNGIIGNPKDRALLIHLSTLPDSLYSSTVSETVFCVFHLMFAVVTSGKLSEISFDIRNYCRCCWKTNQTVRLGYFTTSLEYLL